MFAISVVTEIGNGNNTLFCSDRWIHGCSISDLAPSLLVAVAPRVVKNRAVAEAFTDQRWEQDIRGALSAEAYYEYYQLWALLLEFQLGVEEHQHSWVHDSSGSYSSKSAYRAYFQGSVVAVLGTGVLTAIGLSNAAPRHREQSFVEWWCKVERKASKPRRKGVNSAIILGAWTPWKTSNSCVFDGASPNMQAALNRFRDEAHWWGLAGAKKLQELNLGRVGNVS
ncbi:hypothetical protein PR202_ga31174 [Eleusine coracana subsp. coracana]|uniref:Uncharacterized protein n=1 Tax=Eleusine coracana subsp. coracana TaxID=191504 RepID=A0AAV5DQN9_ELECO|nr:hypothetical protein PR202_ga31174 [Eleusine coracana subsp. coracana]